MTIFERKHEQLATREQFLRRLSKFAGISMIIIAGSLFLGAWGYVVYAGLEWIDGFHAAAMILFSEGPVAVMPTYGAKVWEIVYSAYSGVAFLTVIGTFWAPVIHRLYHQFHLSVVNDSSDD